jgi:oligopeptide transport system ATP-binding protein
MSQIRLAETRQATPPILSVNNLTVLFPGRSRGLVRRQEVPIKAVDNVNFEIRESEVFSLVGESGSGKTTTARCILALASSTTGSILYQGTDIRSFKGKSKLDYRREVQVIYQDPYGSLNSREDVFTIVSTPIERLTGVRERGKLEDTVASLLVEVGLDPGESMYKLPHQLSGGERQRVNIARALAPRPKLLIADEPVTMLDASQKLVVLSLLMDLKKTRNLTILLITHDLASARAMSDRTAIMYRGKIVEIGPTESILSKPNHPYTELILESTPRIGDTILLNAAATDPTTEKELEAWQESQEGEAIGQRGCVFLPRCGYSAQVCKDVEPPLEEKSSLHLAACHRPLNVPRGSGSLGEPPIA